MPLLLRILFALGVTALAVGLYLTQPTVLPEANTSDTAGDAQAGALVFAAAGCASCHVAPEGGGEGLPRLAGGQAFASDFGTFYAPNISSDPTHGIGA